MRKERELAGWKVGTCSTHTHNKTQHNTTQQNEAFPQLSVAILACLGKTTGLFRAIIVHVMGVFVCGGSVFGDGGGSGVLTMCPARRIVRKWKVWLTPLTW